MIFSYQVITTAAIFEDSFSFYYFRFHSYQVTIAISKEYHFKVILYRLHSY